MEVYVIWVYTTHRGMKVTALQDRVGSGPPDKCDLPETSFMYDHSFRCPIRVRTRKNPLPHGVAVPVVPVATPYSELPAPRDTRSFTDCGSLRRV